MNCDLNCSGCPFLTSCSEDREFVVNVVGTALDDGFLDFSSSPVVTLRHRGYRIRFVNFAGDAYHFGRKLISSKPDVVLDVVDSMKLEDSLDLTSRLIDLDLCSVLAFSRYDELLSTQHSINVSRFSEMTGMPSIALGKPDEISVSRLLSAIVDEYESDQPRRHVHVPYGRDLDDAIDRVALSVSATPGYDNSCHDRYLAIRLLEDPDYDFPELSGSAAFRRASDLASTISAMLARQYGESVSSLVERARFGFVRGALQETVRHGRDRSDHSFAQRIDTLLTGKLTGLPILFLVLYLVFQTTFTLGAYPQEWIESGISSLSAFVRNAVSLDWLGSLLADGLIQGVGAVLAFLPNIIIMFFLLSVLEDSGYMSRAAFLMDALMHKVGLHGKSFVPMLIGFGCNVPAIMSAKSIEDARDRALTMLMIPFMSCSARLPVYLLLVSAFFPEHKALVMISIYLLGVVLSVLLAFVMKRTKYFRREDADYVSELPPFGYPTWRTIGRHVWERSSDYLKKISTVIVAASIVIWALEFFPSGRTMGGSLKEESCLAMVGKAVEPVTRPLGFDWKMNVCLITGLPAKEAIVSTMGILYHTGDDDASLISALRTSGEMTPVGAFAFMAFVLLYFPCIATISALGKEIGRNWAAFSVVISLMLAWIVSFLIYNLF